MHAKPQPHDIVENIDPSSLILEWRSQLAHIDTCQHLIHTNLVGSDKSLIWNNDCLA